MGGRSIVFAIELAVHYALGIMSMIEFKLKLHSFLIDTGAVERSGAGSTGPIIKRLLLPV